MTRTHNEKLTAVDKFASLDKNVSKTCSSCSDWTESEGNPVGLLMTFSPGSMYLCSFSWFNKQKSNLLFNSFNSSLHYDALW